MTSPFLAPGVQFAWDSTSLGLFKDCPRKYQYSMLENWVSRGTNVHLFFGQVYQKCLETFDRLRAQGLSHEDALIEVTHLALKLTWVKVGVEAGGTDKYGPWESGDANKTRFTLIRSVVWHIETYRDHAAKTYIKADGVPAVELNFKLDVGEGILLCGHLDRVVEWNDDLYVLDHKTTKHAIGQYYFEGYSPDNQMSLYSIAATAIFNTPVTGVIIDAAQVMVGFTRFARGFTTRTPAQQDEWLQYTFDHIAHAHRCAENNRWPQNDTACDKYGGCAFRRVCSASPQMRQRILETEFEQREKPWNPLVPREA